MPKSKRPARVPRAVCREALRISILAPEKLPDDYRAYHEQVMLHCRRIKWATTVLEVEEACLGRFDVIVRAADKCRCERQNATGRRPKTSEHRVFIVCDCGQQVPAGRLHQHVCKETK